MISKSVNNQSANPKRVFWSTIIGNLLDHYDSALYVFLTPFFASVFFPDSEPSTALICTYAIRLINIITRPLGAIIFGYLALQHPVSKLLAISLGGVALFTFTLSLIPSYDHIGILAPLLLALSCLLQGIFAAGENTLVGLFILEQTLPANINRPRASSYYLSSTMVGTMLASLSGWLISNTTMPYFYWRVALIPSLLAGLVGVYIRYHSSVGDSDYIKPTGSSLSSVSFKDILPLLSKYRWQLVKIIVITSFSYLTYLIPFVFLNNFLPLFSTLQVSALYLHNTYLAIIDILLILAAGYLIGRFNITYWMLGVSLLFTVTIIPLFYLLPQLGIIGVNMIKLWIIMIGVAFLIPLNELLCNMYPHNAEKYLLTGLGSMIGSELFGKTSAVIGLLLWHWTHHVIAPAIYFALIATGAIIALLSEYKSGHH